MNPRDVIIQKDYAHSMLLMVLKGECIGLDDNVNAMNRNVVLGQGTVYGVSNFLEERPFQHNVYCRQKGICMIVTKTMFSRVMKDKSNLALQFYRFLVKQ
jgi:signal-transduction protein with cAMP-binding, CBS, and nucleotidyltransferase domain